MEPRQFASKYLNWSFAEKDLQDLIKRRLQMHGLPVWEERHIKTASTTRRSDLETLFTRYELKRELTYENLKSAFAQLIIYNHYGSKILWVIPKRKCIIGLTPLEHGERLSAQNLAEDIRAMGVKVVFIDEQPKYLSVSSFHSVATVALLALSAFGISLLLAIR